MGRNRSFDEDEVLWRAMDAFRRHGYAGISIKRLEEETGLTSGSLYNAYGDKDGLFRAALDHYVACFVEARLDAYAGPDATLDNLQELFLTLFREPLSDGYGCLVVNSAVEFGSARSPAADGIRQALDRVEAGLHAVLAREIGPAQGPLEADRLMLLYQGILVLARAGRSAPGFEDVIRSQFDSLRKARDRFRSAQDNKEQ